MTRDLAVAVGFLTRLPVRPERDLGTAALSRAAVWFPVVGVLVGGVVGATHAAAGLALEPGPATVLALLAGMLVTGALHEDGLADCADALGAHVGRERRAEILHDPRVGTFGALALGSALLLAYAALSPLDDEHVLRAAIVGHVLGRWSTLPLSLAATSPAARSGALVRAGAPRALIATVLAATTCVIATGWLPAAAALGAAGLITALGARVAARALGGVSGDVYGAVNKLVEVTSYLVLGAAWG